MVFLILSPICVFRFIVAKSVRLFRPDLGNILTAHSTLTGVDDTYGSPDCSVFTALLGEGDMQLEPICDRMTEVINLKNSNGQLLYPELQQSITKFMGFMFWKWDKHFDINNHVKYFNHCEYNETLSNDEITEDEFRKVIPKLNREPFKANTSPWEFRIFKNYKPKCPEKSDSNYTLIVFRFGHSLSDAYSFLKLLGRHIIKDESFLDIMPKPSNFKRPNAILKYFKPIWTLLKMPFELTKLFFITPADSNHGWRKSEKEITHNMFYGIGKAHDLGYFKEIKTSLKCSLTSVLFAGIAGGIRKMMIEQGLSPPKFIKVACPFPMPGHPNKLRNHMALGLITLPIQEEDPLTRLRIINEHFKQISHSSVPVGLFIIGKFTGSLFAWMVKFIAKIKLTTGLISNLPGAQKRICFLGCEIEHAFFAGGLLRGDVGKTYFF